MTVSFIYSFCNNEDKGTEKEWKWIIGKELTMQRDLSDFVNDSKTLFHYLSRSRAKSYMVFANNKKELSDKNIYYMSPRDADHNDIGSVFGATINFGNRAETFVQGVLVISSYGETFINKNNNVLTENEFKNLLFERIFPYYQRLIETELGIKYLHLRNQMI